MTVNPGFGGQEFIHETLPKIQQAEAWRRERKLPYRISVDGGINYQTAAECARAGADTFVAGTSLVRPAQPESRRRTKCGKSSTPTTRRWRIWRSDFEGAGVPWRILHGRA